MTAGISGVSNPLAAGQREPRDRRTFSSNAIPRSQSQVLTMNSRVLILSVLALAMSAAPESLQAAIIGNFDDLDFDSPSLPGNGQFDAPAMITVDTSNLYGGPVGTITFNLQGLNVTGDSSANDTASIVLNVSSVGGDITDTGANGSQIGITGNNASGLSDPSELLTFSFASGSVTLGDPGVGAAVNFIGFRNVALNGFGDPSEVAVISGGTLIDGSFTGANQSPFNAGNAFGNVPSFTINAGNASDNFGVERIGARIEFLGTATAVPEPSSAALLVVGAVGFILRRRRTRGPISMQT